MYIHVIIIIILYIHLSLPPIDYEVCNESDLFQGIYIHKFLIMMTLWYNLLINTTSFLDGFINVTGVLDKGNRNTTTRMSAN